MVSRVTTPDGGVGRQDRESFACNESNLQKLRKKYPLIQDIYPATPMQHGLISFSNTVNNTGAYNMQVVLELGRVDNCKLKRAFELIIQEHDVLRTVFEEGEEGTLLQVVLSDITVDWREKDFDDSGVEGEFEDSERVIESLSEKERLTSFNHTQSLMRFLLIRKSENSFVLIWTHHHALLDGWSLTILMGELSATYNRLLYSDDYPKLSPVPFKRYVEWLHKKGSSDAEQFWKNYLKGFSSATQVSFVKPNVEREVKQCVVSHSLSDELTQQLYAFSASEDLAPNSIVQLAWGIILSKFSRENEVLFGYAVSGRASAAEVDGIVELVGMCLNALPMRLSLLKEKTVREHLIDLQKQLEQALDFEYLPFETIQKLSEVPAGEQLFDSFVTMENMPLDHRNASKSLDVKSVETRGHNNFGLNLVVRPGKQLKVDLVYNSVSYSQAHAITLLDCYCQVLSEIKNKFDAPLSTVIALTKSQVEQIYQWNNRLEPLPQTENIWERFVVVVKKNPSAFALVYNDEKWTYGDLWHRALCLRKTFRATGITPGEFVAIALPKSPEFVTTILALYALDCAYVPLGLDLQEERCGFILKDTGIRWVISNLGHSEKFSIFDVSILNVDQTDFKSEAQCMELPSKAADIPAYVIYTSGTTGKPKGVVITHRNIANFCHWVANVEWITQGSRVTQFAPLTFDASVGEIFATLWAGAELHLLTDELIQDPIAVSHYLQKNNITFSAFPPDYLNEMNPEYVDKNSIIITAGSAPSLKLINAWKKTCRYVNAYGPTETTVLSSYWELDKQAQTDRIYIGTPVNNTEIYIVDQFGQLCPDGVIGEVWIGGAGVAEGYLNLPGLNTEKFIENHFSGEGRLYKTGDLARRYNDSNIEIIGRDDQQVKIRGHRIELGEIEAVFSAHHYVVATKAVAISDLAKQKKLAIYLVLKNGVPDKTFEDVNSGNEKQSQDLIREFRDYAKNQIPDYMVPAYYIFIDELPKTENGKIDLKSLPHPDDSTVLKEVYVSARNNMEVKLVNIWAEVLGLDAERLGVHDNFFEAGGDSLKVMALVKKLSSSLELDIPPAKIFRYPSINLLCLYLEDSSNVGESRTVAIQKGKSRMEKLKRKKIRN